MSFFGFEDRSFYSSLRKLAIPMMLQQLVASSMTMVDNLMIGSLGDNALAGLMQASQVTFVFLIFIFGIPSATTALTSQFWGSQDLPSIRRTFGLSLICGQVIGWGFCILCAIMPQTFLLLFTNDPEVLALGAQYLSIVCFSYPFIGAGFILGAIMRGTGDVKFPMATALTGLAVNVVFNYILIYGKLGLPALGIQGAANESFWSMAQFTVMLCYARIGTQMSAATGIFNSFDKMGYVIFVGLSNACAVQCGRVIGEGNLKKAQTYATRYMHIIPFIAIGVAIVLNIAAPFIMHLYDASADVIAISLHIIRIFGCMLPILMLNNLIVVGILRSGGDARFSLFLDAGFQWTLILIPVALAAFVFHISPMWVYAFTAPGEIIKFFVGRRRVRSGAWIHTLTYEANL